MPPLKDVDSMVTAARSRDMRFTFIIQNFAQLNDVYGKEVAEVIRGNCGNTIYLISSELAALEEISKMCGEVKSKEKDKTASTPLVTVSDLQKFKMGEALLIRMRKGPFKTKLQFDYKTNWGYEQIDEPFPERAAKPVALFDIKAFVKEKKKEQSLNNPQANNNPFGPNLFDNPFGSSPFGGANPFGTSANPFGPSNPFETTSTSSPSTPSVGLDLDAMLKDIDRKIAELDAEEAKEKEANAKKEETPKLPETEVKEPAFKNTLQELSSIGLDNLTNNSLFNNIQEPQQEIKPEIKEGEVITEEPKQVVEPKPIEAPTVKPEPINFGHNLDKNEELSPISNTKTDFNDFNKSDIDTLLANLLGSNNKEEETQEVKEAKTEEVKPLPKVEIPKEPSVEPIKEEPIINNSEILEEVPQYNPNASLRDLLYNPQNANIKENNNVFINEDLINKEKDNYLKSTISSPVKEEPVKEETIKEEPIKKEVKPVTNEVIKSEDKPIINVKPDDIKIDDNISDDEFFDDFFGED